MKAYAEELTPGELALLQKRDLLRGDLRGRSKAENGGVVRCTFCRCEISQSKTRLVHIVPLSQGGETDVKNVVLSCPLCCQNKHGKTLNEWCVHLMTMQGELQRLMSHHLTPARKEEAAPSMDHCGAA